MKNQSLVIWIASLAFVSTMVAEVIIPEQIRGELNLLERKLDDAREPDSYSPEDYLADLGNLGKGVTPELQKQLEAEEDLSRSEILLLHSSWLQDQKVKDSLAEIETCYGRPAHAVPRDLRLKLSLKEGKNSIRVYKPGEGQKRAGFPGEAVLPLFLEHKKPDYLPAYEVLLMSPPSQARTRLRGRALEALGSIREPSVIPVLMECFKAETSRAKDVQAKQLAAAAWIDVIRTMPVDDAVSALLECNRLAIAGGFNGEGRHSISRHIVRGLSSRRMYADQMEDPKMLKMLKDKGRPVDRVEDVPLTDDLWEKYKPLLQARVKQRTKETPAEDIALVDAALAAMPSR